MKIVVLDAFRFFFGFSLVALAVDIRPSNAAISSDIEICSTGQDIWLSRSGEGSARTVTLSPVKHKGVCKLRVIAPKTHVINMQFVQAIKEELHSARNLSNETTSKNYSPCMMSVYLPENPRLPVWKGDPCSDRELEDIDLLTPDFRIVWNPPSDPSFSRGKTFVITAVGQGAICKEAGQHTCMRIGWEPILCISERLVCDRKPNCPVASSSSDEDEKMCKQSDDSQSSLEQIAEWLKTFQPTENRNTDHWIQEKLLKQLSNNSPNKQLDNDRNKADEPKKTFGNWRKWQEVKPESTTSTTEKPDDLDKKSLDTLSAALSKYGPWGYLVLGCAICGTVLMFCGLWECCCKRPKIQADATTDSHPHTTVLIINPEEMTTSNPPNYDDLDQPPSYATLFPNFFKSNIAHCSLTTSQANCAASSQNSISVICDQVTLPYNTNLFLSNHSRTEDT